MTGARRQKTEDRGQNLVAAARRFYQKSAAKPHKASVFCFLIKQLAIRPGEQTTLAKSLVMYSVLCYLPSAFAIDGTRPAYTPSPPAVNSSSIAQIIFSLLLVLAAIVLVAWAFRRMNMGKQGAGNHLKVLSGIAIGQRERVVLIEIKDTWLVVGVGPGQIRTLHTIRKPENGELDSGSQDSQTAGNPNQFAAALSSALDSISSGKRDAP